jgi:dUTP pyrophosphatase
MSLYIYVADQKLRELYCAHKLSKHRYTDSGFDVLLPEQIISFDNNSPRTIHTAIVVAAVNDNEQPTPCLLLPRSSISNTVYRLTNSIGLIDMGYRGEVMAKCDSCYPNDNTGYLIDEGTRLFQIVQHNFLPWKNIYIVDDMSKLPAAPDNRGTGGFGSTG